MIDPQAMLDPLCLVIGDVHIGANTSLWPGVVVRGDIHHIRIGSDSNIQDGCVLHVSHDGPYMPGGSALIIGDRVTVGHKAVLHGCTIGNDCLIGMGAIVMDRAVIEPGVMIGAGSPGATGQDAAIRPSVHRLSGASGTGTQRPGKGLSCLLGRLLRRAGAPPAGARNN